jgi:hypothetical protein
MTVRSKINAIRIAIKEDGATFTWRLLNRREKIIGGIGAKRGEASTRDAALRDAISAADAFAMANRGQLFQTRDGIPVYLRFDPDSFVEYRGEKPVLREKRYILSHSVTISDDQVAELRAEMVRSHPDRGGTCEAFIAARTAYVLRTGDRSRVASTVKPRGAMACSRSSRTSRRNAHPC